MKRVSNTKQRKPNKASKARPSKPVGIVKSELEDSRAALSALAKSHQQQTQMLAALVKSPQSRGAFSNLGGDVDSMIEHGQEAWAAVKRLLNSETKFAFPTGVISLGWVGTGLDITSQISQGLADYQREGDSIKINHLSMKLRVDWNPTQAIAMQHRLMVVRSIDEAVSAANVNVSDSTAYAPLGQPEWDYRKQYEVLHDEIFFVDLYHAQKVIHLERKLDSHAQFANGSTTVTKGAIQFFLWTDQNTNKSTVTYTCGLQFVDN